MARTELELLDGVERGDRTALRALYERHGAAVHACATVLARRPGAPPASDITVAAFTALWRLGADPDRGRPALGMLLRLAAREAATAPPAHRDLAGVTASWADASASPPGTVDLGIG